MSDWQPYGGQKINEDRFFEWARYHVRGFKLDGPHRAKGFCPFHYDSTPSLRLWGNSGFIMCRGACAAENPTKQFKRWTYWEFCQKLGINPDHSVFIENFKKDGSPQIACSDYYTYTNEYGEGVLRIGNKQDGTRFCQYFNNGCWINGSNGLKPIYNKHRLFYADPDSACIIVEGEKDAENLTKLGFLATTTPFGASYDLTAFRAEFVHILRFKRIVIIPDNDKPGLHYKDSIIKLLCSLGGNEITNKIKVLNIAQIAGVETQGFDISDYIDLLRSAGKDPKKEIEQLLAQLL